MGGGEGLIQGHETMLRFEKNYPWEKQLVIGIILTVFGML